MSLIFIGHVHGSCGLIKDLKKGGYVAVINWVQVEVRDISSYT